MQKHPTKHILHSICSFFTMAVHGRRMPLYAISVAQIGALRQIERCIHDLNRALLTTLIWASIDGMYICGLCLA